MSNFYRIQELPPHVFAAVEQLKAEAGAAGCDVCDSGLGSRGGIGRALTDVR